MLHTPPVQCAARSCLTALSQSEVRTEATNEPHTGVPKDTLPRLPVRGVAAANAMGVKRPAASREVCKVFMVAGSFVVVGDCPKAEMCLW